MAIPGLFIEYLVTGAVALTWAYPLLNSAGFGKIENSLLPLYALALYVLGMMIDFVAWVVTRPSKQFIRRMASKKYGVTQKDTLGASTGREVRIALFAPDLAKEMLMRSSRDRIARGTFINSILVTIFVVPLFAGIVLCAFTFAMWWGFESVSYKFSLKAEQALNEKIAKA